MKTLIVYDSVHGNTRRVAEAIAAACREAGEVRLERADGLEDLELRGEELLFVGGPTHRQTLSPAMRTLLDHTGRTALRGVRAASFDTRYEMPRWLIRLSAGTAADKIAGRIRGRGARLAVPPESFLIERDVEGPLLEGELERAEAWARTVLGTVGAAGPAAG